jgi:hypothetical protein
VNYHRFMVTKGRIATVSGAVVTAIGLAFAFEAVWGEWRAWIWWATLALAVLGICAGVVVAWGRTGPQEPTPQAVAKPTRMFTNGDVAAGSSFSRINTDADIGFNGNLGEGTIVSDFTQRVAPSDDGDSKSGKV